MGEHRVDARPGLSGCVELELCPGCGGSFAEGGGPTHPYMLSSAGCWARFGEVLAREYSNEELLTSHRLSVDAYAVQHPGSLDGRAIRSTGLHLARLMLQLERPVPPRETNDVMLGLAKSKASLPFLEPPKSFAITVADIPLVGPLAEHVLAVRAWAADAWLAWHVHHDFIRAWTKSALGGRLPG